MADLSAGIWAIGGDSLRLKAVGAFLQIGADAGSGAPNESASIGGIRLPKGGGNDAAMYGRSDTNLDVPLIRWDSAGTTSFGSEANNTNTSLRAATNLFLRLGAVNVLSLTAALARWSAPGWTFLPNVGAVNISQENLSGGATNVGAAMSINAQNTGGTVSATGGALDVGAGAATGTAISIGGVLSLHGGDYTAGTTPQGGDALLRGGDGPGHVRGNVSIGDLVTNAQGMKNGVFLSNATALPTGNPTGGGFLFSNAGALTWRGTAGTVTPLAPA